MFYKFEILTIQPAEFVYCNIGFIIILILLFPSNIETEIFQSDFQIVELFIFFF